MEHLRKLIREVPDFPKAGINFYDITTLLQNAEGLKNTIEALHGLVANEKVDTVIGDSILRKVIRPDLFASIARADHALSFIANGGLLFLELHLIQART